MSLLVPPRRPSRERLDDPGLPADQMRRSLEDLRMVNLHWGASRALERYLRKRIRSIPGRAVSILDVGAGSGDVAARLQTALPNARVTALDLQWRHLRVGPTASRELPLRVAADAFRLPFAAGTFDFAVSTLFFHHFSPAENREILRELTRVATHGFAMLDLRRHRFPEIFVAAAGRLVFRARISIEDGVASVRQAYTTAEALDIARPVAPESRARRILPFRWLLTSQP